VFVCAAYEFARKCTSPTSLLIPLLSIVWALGLTNLVLAPQSLATPQRTCLRVRLFPHFFFKHSMTTHKTHSMLTRVCLLRHRGHPRGLFARASAIVCLESTTDNAHLVLRSRRVASAWSRRTILWSVPSAKTRRGSSAPLPTSPRSSPHRRPKESSMTDPPFPRVCRMGEISM
jgi:hypothetical protein